jgi:hypothetical protein
MKLHYISLTLVIFLSTVAAQGLNSLPDCAVCFLVAFNASHHLPQRAHFDEIYTMTNLLANDTTIERLCYWIYPQTV